MKLAVAGKGGVGKTTVAAGLIKRFAGRNSTVYAVDADPDSCLGLALNLPEDKLATLKPVIEMRDEITRQTGGTGAFYSLNPQVDSFLERYTMVKGRINFFRMGGIKRGGSSCYCRENTFLHALVANLLLERQDVVVMDMGAGIEHLTRGTVKGVDLIVVVTEPTKASVNTAQTVIRLARDLGVQSLGVVANKIRNDREKAYIYRMFPGDMVLGTIPFDDRIMEAAMESGADTGPVIEAALDEIFSRVITCAGVQG